MTGPISPTGPIERAITHLASRQESDGAWRGDYGGPMFLLPIYVAACHICGVAIPDGRREGMARYLKGSINQSGAIGLHIEDEGSMFTSVLGYASLRFLGVDHDDPDMARLRKWIRSNGTALGSASWGKLMLAVLNLMPYEGLNPILPELWLLPRSLPFHPGRMWCHTRQVYLPMAWLYATRSRCPETDITRELRRDLYDRGYAEIDFKKHRDAISPSDNRYPVTAALSAISAIMRRYEESRPVSLREKALKEIYDHICYEDRVTNDIDIGPVNSVLNAIVHHFAAPESERFKKSFSGCEAYIFEGCDGIKFNGYNSTALWDTAFAVQSILASPAAGKHRETLGRAFKFIRENRICDDPPERERYFRHRSKGGWPFSDRFNGWPVTDCTAEGLATSIHLGDLLGGGLDDDLLKESVSLLLTFQNSDGGWASYESQRAGSWLEALNPSQMFDSIMVEHSYVECTSSVLQALVLAEKRLPEFRAGEIRRAIGRGAEFIKKRQRRDGSWEGSWGVCFTYGTWFGVWGLLACGIPAGSKPILKACEFLKERQNTDGGWGESFLSCVRHEWAPHRSSQVVNTAWALMTLARAGMAGTEAAGRAAEFLIRSQLKDGSWPRESLKGVFNKSVLINYDNYRLYFPVWALSEFQAVKKLVL